MTSITPQELQTWLEWAGKRLLAMPGGHVGPRDYKVQWPEFSQDLFEILDFRGNPRLRPPPPSADEITIVDEILILPNVCSNIQIRKILHIRSLIRPLNGSYLYNWTRVAKLLHVDRGTVKRWHRKGLNEVVEKADRRKICYVKNYMDQSQML